MEKNPASPSYGHCRSDSVFGLQLGFAIVVSIVTFTLFYSISPTRMTDLGPTCACTMADETARL
jgi:hypothetical protein